MAYASTHAAHRGTAFDRIATLTSRIATALRERRLYRATFNGLSALSNRELADLGLTRGEIHAVARKSARDAVS